MDNFVRANGNNLPKMTTVMILEYMSSSDKHNIAEIRGVKALMSSRDSYVESAVGFVEVRRSSLECVVRGKVVPEHRVSLKQYLVSVQINENKDIVVETTCDGCAASAGGCKHSLVFLFWLEKKSSEPAPTSVQCYWKKPKLANIKADPVRSEDIFKKSKKICLAPADRNLRDLFLIQCRKHNITNSLATCFTDVKKSYNLFDLTIDYIEHNNNIDDFEKYKMFINSQITRDVIDEINKLTIDQVNSKTWHNIRQGRITASKLYEASQCTTDGTLVQQILGGYKMLETKAIKRGKRLEAKVLVEIEKTLCESIEKSGFILINGIVGASPDGIGDDFVVEIKCPASNNTIKNYINKKGEIKMKFIVQMQAQMLAAGKKKALFCVADPSFEQNKSISLYWVDYNEDFAQELLNKALAFWEKNIYKKIVSSATLQ